MKKLAVAQQLQFFWHEPLWLVLWLVAKNSVHLCNLLTWRQGNSVRNKFFLQTFIIFFHCITLSMFKDDWTEKYIFILCCMSHLFRVTIVKSANMKWIEKLKCNCCYHLVVIFTDPGSVSKDFYPRLTVSGNWLFWYVDCIIVANCW